MSLSAKVNCAYWELENLEKKVKATPLTTPKFHVEIHRLKGECHRLHFDAVQIDELTRDYRGRGRPTPQINDIERRIYLFRNEVGFVYGQFQRFTQWDKNPPQTTTIFSSPSNSPGSAEGSPARSSAFSSSQSSSGSQGSFNSFGSQGSLITRMFYGRHY